MILLLVFAAMVALLLVERFLRLHRVHSLLWTCAHRNNTSRQTRFENLKNFYITKRHVARSLGTSDVVTFDLKDARDGALIIEIPSGSRWYSVTYTHRQPSSCNTITTLSGQWFIGSAAWMKPGPAPPEKTEIWTSFGKLSPKNVLATARLHSTIASRILDHVICSMVQDAEIYFQLCLTPIWIRVLFAATTSTPRLRVALVRRLLWIQIRATWYIHDFYEDHGTVTIFRWINPWSPPQWVDRIERDMRLIISRFMLRLNNWAARKIFGMSTWYEEYKPMWETDGENKHGTNGISMGI